jgi:predicted DsbA family dithiol-disulfide isomerase
MAHKHLPATALVLSLFLRSSLSYPQYNIPKARSIMSSSIRDTEGGACDDGVCLPPGVQKKQQAVLSSDTAKDSTSTSNKNATSTNNNTIRIQIDIISDTMCPWCWVGKRHLEDALRKEQDHIQAEIHWHPYFLDRRLPENGKLVKDYYRDNYGDEMTGERMKPHLIEAGRNCGIDFKTHYATMERFRPTIRSHRLIELAKQQDKQDMMVEELFRMFYEQGKHLNSVDDLVECAKVVGLEGDIEAFLKGSEYEKEVDEAAAKWQPRAEGVPTFLFSRPDVPDQEPISLSGGQPPSAFLRVFRYLSNLAQEGK